jgi:hypothetical protein
VAAWTPFGDVALQKRDVGAIGWVGQIQSLHEQRGTGGLRDPFQDRLGRNPRAVAVREETKEFALRSIDLLAVTVDSTMCSTGT